MAVPTDSRSLFIAGSFASGDTAAARPRPTAFKTASFERVLVLRGELDNME